MLRPLGRLRDSDTDRAIELYPFEAPTPAKVETTLPLPTWLATHDQGREGSCVGHSVALERAIANTLERRVGHPRRRWLRFDPIAVWRAAKGIDEWPSTKPDDDRGTSVRAAYEISRTVGLVPVKTMELRNGRPVPVNPGNVDPLAGVERYEWATTIDAIRAAIAAGVAVSIGVTWFTGFDTPEQKGVAREWWLPLPAAWGRSRGGHSPALTGASDRRQAFRLSNSWGPSYPQAWLPYSTMEKLLARQGEAALVVDRIGT